MRVLIESGMWGGYAVCGSTPKVVLYTLASMAFVAEKDFSEYRTGV